ncbi:hypothetical protein ABT167_27540 [Streptomyces sp. NPDC001792]|uniref:hypothetical protein n=1 Tax=Streptomyces sp. NPDC001792 TaxID=3154524 RepID=UPI00332EDF0E
MAIIATSGVSASTPAQEQRDPSGATLTATEAFEALVAEHGFQVEEWNTDDLDEPLRDKFFAFYVETPAQKTIVVPIGQDPEHRLAALRALLAHPGVIA